jgi:hypothetical protein
MAVATTPIAAPEPYANVENLTLFWQAPTDSARALVLLTLASNRLRLMGEDVGVDTDTRSNDSAAYFSTIQWVVMESVKRALQAPTDSQPVETYGQAAGPYSENFKYSNPTGDLWFKRSELQPIGLHGKQELGSLNTSQNLYYDIYSS